MDRGLYGANVHYQPLESTSFGEARMVVDGFAADPGTVAGRDEFLGTGGSLYFPRGEGSERVRIEVRDKDSGICWGQEPAAGARLQYRLPAGTNPVAKALAATADDGLLVQKGPISGNPVFLVIRYEFTPWGLFDDPNTLRGTGGRVHYWFNDYVKVGVTASRDEAADTENTRWRGCGLRKSSESWSESETGRSKGPGVPASTALDRGFGFSTGDDFNGSESDASAIASKFKDIFENGRGRVTFSPAGSAVIRAG